MSRGFVKDGDQEEVPIVPPRAFLPKGAVNYVTEEGMESLLREKENLILERDGLSGNETDKRIAHNFINAKLQLLDERIRSAVIADPQKIKEDEVGFGAWVTIKAQDESDYRHIRITGADESDVLKGYITYFSPLAQAIAGHKVGENVEMIMPSGKRRVSILNISYSKPSKLSKPLESSESLELSKLPTSSKSLYAQSNSEANKKSKTQKKSAIQIIENQIITKNDTITNNNAIAEIVNKDNLNEILPIVNNRGLTIGHAPRWQCHDGSKLLHPVVHLHVFNSKGELYLQQRPTWKDIQPGKWDTAVGGHVGFGESVENALKRESKEELGIDKFIAVLVKKYIFESTREKELINTYKTTYARAIYPSKELDGGRFWSIQEIRENIGKNIFTPNFEKEFSLLVD